jgi:hypothetical protein
MPENKDNPVTTLVKEGGETANATVDATGKLASHVVKDVGKVAESTEHAVAGVGTGAIHGVGKVGGAAGGLAKDAVMNTATIPHDVIKSAKSGEPSK